VRRRDFITFLGGAVVEWPLTASAQTQPKIPRVGCAFSGTPTTGKHLFEAFRQSLRELGYVEGQTIVLEVRWAEGRYEHYPGLVVELVGLKVDVLVVTNSQATRAAMKTSRTIPIVMFATDPVRQGLVTSLSHPGGNVTGLSFYNEELSGKRLQILREFVPELTRLAVIRNRLTEVDTIFWQDTEVAAQKLGVALQSLEVRGPEDFEAAFAGATRGGAQALLVFDDPLTVAYRSRITALAASSRLPVMYGYREFPDAGGLMSYGPSVVFLFRRAATFVDKILKGAKPTDLPVEQPTKFELVINLQTAKTLGLTIPPSLLSRADEVIE
jgi:putative ABC transport system substrate-binding protein